MKRMKLLFTLAFPVFLCQNVQAQSSSRLTAESQWTNNGAYFLPVDSASFLYATNGRGGDLTHSLKFDTSFSGIYDSSMTFDPQVFVEQTFDAHNNITSVTTSQNISGTGWVLAYSTIDSYNTSNLIINEIQQSWGGTSWVPLTENVFSYTGVNQLWVNQHYTWTGASFAADTQKVYTYTTSGLVSSELDGYTVSGFPYYYMGFAYSYDTSGHLISVTTSTFSGSITTAVPVSMVQYSWDGSNDITSMEKEHYSATSMGFVGDTLYSYSAFTGAHNPQTTLVQYYDTSSAIWVNMMQFTNSYNSYGQLTTSVGTAWNIVGRFEHAVGDPQYNYYYATYSGSTVSSVKNVVSNNGDASIYPVPAQNVVNIAINWYAAQSAFIGIYDVQGRLVKSLDSPYGTQYTCSVPVNDLSAGIYVIRITGQQGQIIKEFEVAH